MSKRDRLNPRDRGTVTDPPQHANNAKRLKGSIKTHQSLSDLNKNTTRRESIKTQHRSKEKEFAYWGCGY